jgi:transcriptional regulator with XRE-family HTH domain
MPTTRKRSPKEHRTFVKERALAAVALVLADALESRGITQRELAKRLGVTAGRVSQILGADANLSVSTLARLADALDCELTILLVPKKGSPR